MRICVCPRMRGVGLLRRGRDLGLDEVKCIWVAFWGKITISGMYDYWEYTMCTIECILYITNNAVVRV
jgi:hypothetical protein